MTIAQQSLFDMPRHPGETDPSSLGTPPDIVELVARLAPIGLDPCGNAGSVVGARREYRLDRGEDGLDYIHQWRGHGLVYINPPYERGELAPWLERAVLDFASIGSAPLTNGDECVCLVPAWPDRKWFHEFARRADALCFYGPGRINFLGGAHGGGTFPSLFIYFGARPMRFEAVFKPHGLVVFPDLRGAR